MKKKIQKKTLFSMQLFSADAMIFSIFFALENIKNPPSKDAHNRPNNFYFMYWLAAQTSPELIFHVINMSQDASVLLSVH